MRRIKHPDIALKVIISASLLACMISLSLFIPQSIRVSFVSASLSTDDTASLDPSIDFVQIGLTGSITTNMEITQLGGKKAVLLGTSTGLYIISEGNLKKYIATPGSVTDISILNDITGDSEPEIVITLDDTRFPNIRCYNGVSGERIWDFASSQQAFLENILWTEIETPTFDITAIADINSDGYQDLAATSGYGLYVLNGETGKQIWQFEAEDNLWEIAVIPDMNGDEINELAVGAQTGFLYVLDGVSGEKIWQKRISEKMAIYDDSGEKWATVETSVWDILPVQISGKQMAVVSSEDAVVRLIDLEDGTNKWETSPLIEYSASLLFTYYRQKSKLPTSPGDNNFFNLRVFITDDVNSDGVGDIIASTYAGQSSKQGSSPVNSVLYMIDGLSGSILWSNQELALSCTAEIETASIDGKEVILLPQEKSGSTTEIQIINLEDGKLIETLEITSPRSSSSDKYWTKELEADSFITVNSYDDLLCISAEGEVKWYYPRISNVVVETGDFTGDSTEDLFIWSKQRISDNGDKYGTRLLYVVDGATRSEAWSYEMSYEDMEDTQGITSIMVTPDLDGDGKKDIVGYTVPRSSDDYGEGYRLLAFSGLDGDLIINQPVVSGTYYGLYDELYKAREAGNLDTTIDTMLAQGVQPTYYEIYTGLTSKPLLKSQVDYFIDKILADNSGDYDPNLRTNNPGRISDIENNLDNTGFLEGQKIRKKIIATDVIDLQGEPAIVVSCPQEVFILDSGGSLLWIGTYNTWAYHDPFTNSQPENWQMTGNWNSIYLSTDDLNNDNIDDLIYTSGGSIYVLDSNLSNNSLSFTESSTIFEQGNNTGNTDQNRVALIDDIDGDSFNEVSFPIWRDNQPEVIRVVSPVNGEILLEEVSQGGQSTITSPSADFNGDGSLDRILYSSWRENLDRPVVEIVSGGSVIWQYEGYQEGWFLNNAGLTDIVPAAAISDQNGDGIPDIALIKYLLDQPGATIEIWDTVKDEIIKGITLESIDKSLKWDRRWNPGIAIQEVGDFNGDGTNEIAVVTLLTSSDSGNSDDSGGQQGQDKEVWLMVVDTANEEAMAEFQILTKQFVETENDKEMVVVGMNGEVYFLNMESSFRITAPQAESSSSSPVTMAWDGVPEGSYYQIYIDDAEVARTNDNEITLEVSRGTHKLVVRSMDVYGRGLYTSTTFTVEKSTSIVIFASIGLILSLAALTYPRWFKLIPSRRKESGNG